MLVEAHVSPSKYFYTIKKLKLSTLPEHNYFKIEGLSSFFLLKGKLQVRLVWQEESPTSINAIEAMEVAINSPIDLVFVLTIYMICL